MVLNKTAKPEPIDTRTTKEKLWAEFENQSDDVLTLAYMYSRGYDLAGEDVTKAWTNAIRNNQIIEQVYQKGYEDALKDIENKKRRDFYRKVMVDLKE